MTDKQRTVIWLGLILVALNLATKWSQVRSLIFGSPAQTSTKTSTTPTTTPTSQTPTTQVV